MDKSTSSSQVLASVDADVPTIIISKTYLPLTQDSLMLLQERLQDFSFKGIRDDDELGWLVTFANDQRGAKHCRRVFKHVSSWGWQARISETGPYMRSNHGSVFDPDASVSSRVSEQSSGSHKRRRLMSPEHATPAPANTLPLHGYAGSIVGGLPPPRYAISKPKGSSNKSDKRTTTLSSLHNNKWTPVLASEPTASQLSTERVRSANIESSDSVMPKPTTPMALLMREIMMESGAPQRWTSQMLVEKIRKRHPYYAEVFPQKTLKSNVPSYLSQSPYFRKVPGSSGSVQGNPYASLWELVPARSKQNITQQAKSARLPRREVQSIQDFEPTDLERVDETYFVKNKFTAQFEICTRRAHVVEWNNLEVLEEACYADTVYKPGETARILIDNDDDGGDYAHIVALRQTEKLGVAASVLWYKSKSDAKVKRTPGAMRDLTDEQGQYLLTTHVDVVSVETLAGLASAEVKARLSTTSVIDMKTLPWKIRASDESQVSWMRQYVTPQHTLDGARAANRWQDRRASVTSIEDTTLIGAHDGSTEQAANLKDRDEAPHEKKSDLHSEVQQLHSEKEALQNKVDRLQKDVKDLQRSSQGMMQLESRVEALEARETQMKEIRDFLVRAGHAELLGGRVWQEGVRDLEGSDE